MDILADEFHGAAHVAGGSRKRAATSQIPQQPSAIFRHVLFGGVVRQRAYCATCRRATDVLSNRTYISLRVGARATASPVRLQDLFEAWGNVGGAARKCERGCSNSLCDVEQRLDREPPVLAIVLNRLEVGKKKRSPVIFPEELTCMRSGRYTLSSVLLHRGDSAQDGHFLSICSLGTGAYVQCDEHELCDLTWPDVDTQSTWQDACLLLYSRRGGMVAGAGTEADPSPSMARSSISRAPLPREAVDADTSVVPQFPQMAKEASASKNWLAWIRLVQSSEIKKKQ